MRTQYAWAALLLPALASAETTTGAPAGPDRDTIIVTAARLPQPLDRTGSAVSLVTRQEIIDRQATTTASLLRDLPGIAVARSGPVGSQTQLRMRGAEANQVLVLIDGVEANDLAGADEFAFEHLGTLDIERIEVVRGPQSALWGSEALAGVINVVTRRPASGLQADAYLEGGAYGTVNGGAWAGGRAGRGYASAKFTPEQLKEQEDHLLKTVNEFLPWPSGPVRWLLKQGIGVNNRRLPEYVSEEEKLEILGLVEGSVDHHPDDVPLYHRVLNYHAAHDISHMLIDNPLVVKRDLVGCTGFAVWGPATQDGGLLLARNFDWEAGEVFDRSKVIFYVWPEKGLPYVHVAWSGMAGAVTGMNARGIAVSLNAARTDDSGRFGTIGTPVSLLVKRVLNEAESIEQAVKIIRDTPVFVSDSYLVASAREKRAVVVEKSPGSSTAVTTRSASSR